VERWVLWEEKEQAAVTALSERAGYGKELSIQEVM
jgi:hypothetical protein